VLPSVPRVFEKVHSAVLAKFGESTGVKRKLVDWALRVGTDVSGRRQRGEPSARAWRFSTGSPRVSCTRKVHERLGGRSRLCISGGAPLAKEIIEFFHALDV
jgi:long-chain acyl-CoA synthetase